MRESHINEAKCSRQTNLKVGILLRWEIKYCHCHTAILQSFREGEKRETEGLEKDTICLFYAC